MHYMGQGRAAAGRRTGRCEKVFDWTRPAARSAAATGEIRGDLLWTPGRTAARRSGAIVALAVLRRSAAARVLG